MDKTVYFEVCQKVNSTLTTESIKEITKLALQRSSSYIPLDKNLLTHTKWTESCRVLDEIKDHIDSIVCTLDRAEKDALMNIELFENWKIFVYSLSQEASAMETMQHDSEELSVASHIILPSLEYRGLWESLYYDNDIKNNLLNFIETTMIFSDRMVDPNIISWNKVILLHGPPGTGKTSLCKALAQKAAIRLGERYSYVELIEINSHSLFSKWFSESGKLVMKLFDEVRRLLQNSRALVCVLIDEVESLAHARKSCTNGTEPSDAIRVVNALLTQLDQIKSYPNIMILTTSNVTEAIDLAFVDRADIKQYIGQPQEKAIHKIYESCIEELTKKGLVMESPNNEIETSMSLDENPALASLCRSSVGLSGRSLRKIPFLAYAMYVRSNECSMECFFQAMERIIEKHKEDECLKK